MMKRSENELRYIILVVVLALVVVDGAKNGHGRGWHRGRSHGGGSSYSGLKPGFYWKSCPQAEEIVKSTTIRLLRENPKVNLAAKLLRLHFHDCFVRGCDASVLLDPVGNGTVEKQARPNLSLGGFEVIDKIKNRLEEECPGVVSCADIIALSARDAVSYSYDHGDLWSVPTGRRDGVVSIENETVGHLPSPFADFATLKHIFVDLKNLDIKDLVALSGGHTIGISHCGGIVRRLFNFDGNGNPDPSLNSTYAAELKKLCPTSPDPATEVDMDPKDSTKFNNNYFKILLEKKGLFVSDAALLTDKDSFKLVQKLQNDNHLFFKEFAKSMERMLEIKCEALIVLPHWRLI